MADLIKVTPESLRTKATELRSAGTGIETILGQIKTQIDTMIKTWEGAASSSFLTRFNSLNAKFPEKKETIERYAKFLEDAATGFEMQEKETGSQAEGLIS